MIPLVEHETTKTNRGCNGIDGILLSAPGVISSQQLYQGEGEDETGRTLFGDAAIYQNISNESATGVFTSLALRVLLGALLFSLPSCQSAFALPVPHATDLLLSAPTRRGVSCGARPRGAEDAGGGSLLRVATQTPIHPKATDGLTRRRRNEPCRPTR